MGAAAAVIMTPLAGADAPADAGHPGAGDIAPPAIDHWCMLPGQRPRLRNEAPPELLLDEVEPNSDPATAQTIPLGSGPGQARDIDIAGAISTQTDRDYFRVTLSRGDLIGVAAVASNGLDPLAGVVAPSGERLLQSIADDADQASFFPDESPLPGGDSQTDAVFTWFAPQDGTYLILVESLVQITAGEYTLKIRLRRAGFESAAPGGRQILFLDFDGAKIEPEKIWGNGNKSADLSPLSAFLPRWSLPPDAEDDVIDATIANFEQRFQDLSDVPDAFGVEIRNSRDHPDPGVEPNVSRVIIGGTVNEIGFLTIGRSSSIDPGNFGTEDLAVVLLDLLSAGRGEFAGSINGVLLAEGFTKAEFVGRVLGNAAAHEAGHFLGSWHTRPDNDVRCLMDQGSLAGLRRNLFGVGLDGVAGTEDDEVIPFAADEYSFNEEISFGVERTDLRTGFALSVRGLCAADLDGDGVIAASDLAALMGAWGSEDPDADLNGDGVVGASDLASLLGTWGPCS